MTNTVAIPGKTTSANYTRAEWALLTSEQRGPCDEWWGARDNNGYGKRRVNKVLYTVHRLAWVEANGSIPPETPYVLHHCDVPACYRVSHLFLGTQKDNMQDMIDKGRSYQGAFDSGEVVRLWSKSTLSCEAVGELVGCGPDRVAQILRKSGIDTIRRPATGDRNGARTHPERMVRGDKNGMRVHSRLSPLVDNIREEYKAGGVSQRALAQKYETSQSNVSMIVNGLTHG